MTRIYEDEQTHRVVSTEPDIHGEALTECGGLVRFDLTYYTRVPSVDCPQCIGDRWIGDAPTYPEPTE